MRTIKIFLASSAELDADKEKFELFISNKNKVLREKRIFLELITWKDFISAISEERSQKKYNDYINSCDIAVFLLHTKLGQYTKEEFENAHQAFLNSKSRVKKPLIYTYFKTDKNETPEIRGFKSYIDQLNHFYDTYETLDDLLVKFNQQLEKLEESNILLITERIDAPLIIKYAIYYFILPLFVLSGAFFSYYYFQPINVTVRVIEIHPIPSLPFKEGTVTITYGDKTETLPIKDEVIFKQIPSKHKYGQAKLHFDAQGYKSIDTITKISCLINLSIKRDNSLSLIFGWVRDENSNPLKDAVISIKNLTTQTDKEGKFKLNIPFEQQTDTIRLTAFKEGYKVWDLTGSPSHTIEWKIILQKI